MLVFAGLPGMVASHEMWIEPVKYAVAVGDNIYAHEKVGQHFKGNEYAYLSTSYKSLNISVGDETRPVKSRLGDIPAVKEKAKKEGLHVLSAITSGSKITYESWDKFESFIKEKGLDWVIGRHKERGLPQKDFTESYRRYPKSLIKVGLGKGNDREFGLPLEWVAETNPYISTEDIKLRLLWQGKPYVNAQVDVFNRVKSKNASIELIESHLMTDDEGRVIIPRAQGGEFLINAVRMLEPSVNEKTQKGIVWESLWASLTYKLL